MQLRHFIRAIGGAGIPFPKERVKTFLGITVNWAGLAASCRANKFTDTEIGQA